MTDASAILNQIAGGLDALANQISTQYASDHSMMELWGWNMPGMSFNDLADLVRKPKEVIQRIDSQFINDADIQRLQTIPPRIAYIQAHTLPQLPGGNAANAFSAINGFLQSLNLILEKYNERPLELKSIEDNKLLPASQIKELKKMDAGIKRLTIEAGDIEQKIGAINSAHAVAQSLPADIQSLEDARVRYEAAIQHLEQSFSSIEATKLRIEGLYQKLSEAEQEASIVLSKANGAYSAATTVGLGAAFADRAKVLSRNTWTLGFLLMIVLGVGGWITFIRVEFVHQLMLRPSVSYGILWLNVTFTALSISGPVWFAWLLTRQIGQRFRLSEDYGYKATVAKAYEGYRKEAAQIDVELGKKLFSIALDRLSEAPLRLVEKESPGSPVHDAHGKISNLFPRKASASIGPVEVKLATEDE